MEVEPEQAFGAMVTDGGTCMVKILTLSRLDLEDLATVPTTMLLLL